MPREGERPRRPARIPGTPTSALPGILWPAIPQAADMALLALHEQFMHTQWWPRERIEQMQSRQLALLLRHARRTVRHYQQALPAADALTALPILSRAQLQENPSALASSEVPREHLPAKTLRSSGSTGSPVEVKVTALTSLFRRALYLREHFWQARDLTLQAAAIRNFRDGSGMPPEGKHASGWASAYATPPVAALNIRATIDEQLRWLERVRPAYLSTFPTNLRALAQEALARGLRLPGLRQVCTYAESPPPGLAALARRAFDCTLADIYSSEETGPIAFQCPRHEHYHVQAEHLIVEVVDAAGRPCAPGETGRVLVTDLHNFATPLVRYEIGDHAEAGAPCDCGRGLPVVKRILGRTRNMLRMPGGQLRWPSLPSGDELGTLAPVRQFQLVQQDFTRFELRLVAARALSGAEEERVRAAFVRDLGGGVELALVYLASIAPGAGRKYEDFRCDMAP
jgi:phenylacetate-CoA ligase